MSSIEAVTGRKVKAWQLQEIAKTDADTVFDWAQSRAAYGLSILSEIDDAGGLPTDRKGMLRLWRPLSFEPRWSVVPEGFASGRLGLTNTIGSIAQIYEYNANDKTFATGSMSDGLLRMHGTYDKDTFTAIIATDGPERFRMVFDAISALNGYMMREFVHPHPEPIDN